jgi:DNA-binding CsgD family transcriptional regulator
LQEARAAFEELGAARWADVASSELEATGLRARARKAGPVLTLTARELQIADLLAEGRTTRETAAALFLSPKTVEYHLRHIYTKLDITSRADLRARLPELVR